MAGRDSVDQIEPGRRAGRRERIAATFSGEWLPRILIESALVVFSILLALAVSEWASDREDERLAVEALGGFHREIRQNRARLEDVGPYRRGLRDVIARMAESGEIASVDAFQATIGLEPLRPAFLTSTVWETALTTGAIPHIQFDVVNALSLTYSLQERLEELSRSGFPDLARGSHVDPADMPGALREVAVYLGEVSRSESDLLAAYDEVLRILDAALARENGRTEATPPPGPDGANP